LGGGGAFLRRDRSGGRTRAAPRRRLAVRDARALAAAGAVRERHRRGGLVARGRSARRAEPGRHHGAAAARASGGAARRPDRPGSAVLSRAGSGGGCRGRSAGRSRCPPFRSGEAAHPLAVEAFRSLNHGSMIRRATFTVIRRGDRRWLWIISAFFTPWTATRLPASSARSA